MQFRMEQELLHLPTEGARRTPQELVRLTLRRHLQKVIEDEAGGVTSGLRKWIAHHDSAIVLTVIEIL